MEDKLITDVPSSTSEQPQDSIPEIQQYHNYSTVGDNLAETILAFIAYAILILGVIVSVIAGGLLITDNYEWDNKIGWAILIGGTFLSMVTWASLMILVNISNNIRQIKHERRN